MATIPSVSVDHELSHKRTLNADLILDILEKYVYVLDSCPLIGSFKLLKLKLQYFGHLMRRADSLEKTLMLGKIEGGRKRG